MSPESPVNAHDLPGSAAGPPMPTPGSPRRNSIRRNVVYAVLGNGLLNLSRLAVLALLAKLATTEIQGIYTYTTIALASPVVLFFGLELRSAFVADARGEFTFGTYRALRGLGMSLAAIVLLVIVLWQTRADANLPLIWMMLAICAGKIVFALAEVYWGVYQRRERLGLLAWSNALRGVTMLLPFVLLFRWLPALGVYELEPEQSGQLMRLAALAISLYVLAWVAIWQLYDRRLVVAPGDVDPRWKWPAVWKLAKQTFPLGLVFLLINLCDTVTQSLIKRAAGDDGWTELGYFGSMRFVTLVAMFLIVQVNIAAGNRLAAAYQHDLRVFVRLAARIAAAALALGAAFLGVAWFHGEWFLRVVYTPAHARYYTEFLILVASQAIVLLAAVFGAVTTYMRQFWIQVPVHLSVLAITTVTAVLLVQPENPVRGGALTELVRSSAQAVLYLGCVLIGVHWRNRIRAT
jgi:O-antigen/teichoic acid export membrane protein